MDKFRKLGIMQPILRVIEEEGFEKPSEIQEKSIPLVLAGKDVIAGSATGSGKTLVFGSGIIQNTERGRGIQVLVLTPTRELCQQVSKALRMFSRYMSLEIVSVYGGAAINPQIQRLRGADVVVGTPGRILDHLERKTIYLKNVKMLVLDEADRMLDMGFIEDVEKIIMHCPRDRQTLLFSATITYSVDILAKKYMRNPRKISAEAYVDPSKLVQIYYDVEDNMKFSLLVHLLKHEGSSLAMVFCNTRVNTDFVARNLNANGVNALAIHGGFSQDKRNKSIQDFHSRNSGVLVCTDVAARGLDIKNVSHVYNYDIPKDSKEYIHRIGRTARAGESGKVINILAKRDWDNFTRAIRDNNLDMYKEELPHIKRARIERRGEQRGFRSLRCHSVRGTRSSRPRTHRPI
jgi:ATP-dependent RNA helicase DeaD